MAQKSKIEIVLSAITQDFEGRLRAATSSLKNFGSEAQRTGAGMSAAKQGVDSIAQSLTRMQALVGTVFAVSQVQGFASSFIKTADAMRNMDAKLLVTAKNTNDYAAAQKTVVDISKASYQGLTEVTTLYARMALATANLNISQQQLADVTKTVALATMLSGSSAAEAAGGLHQFAQAMGSDRLSGEELRSVLENMPMLTKVFVEAVGGSIAKLRKMAEAGKLTTEWMTTAILNAKETIEAQAAAMPATVERALTGLRAEASLYVGSVNQATGITDALAGSIKFLGQNMDAVAKGGALVLSTTLSLFAGRGLAAAVTATTGFIASLGAMGTAAAASTVAISSATSYMSGYGVATTATAATATRLLPAILSLVNPITAITVVLGAGVTAWMLWGGSAENELSKAKSRLSELQRTNQMLKELSDPAIRLQATSNNIVKAKDEVAKLEQDLAAAASGPTFGAGDDGGVGRIGKQLELAQQKLATEEQFAIETYKNISLTADQRAAKEIAGEMSVTDAVKEQDAERRKVTSSKLENDLADIAKKREAELAAINKTFSDEDKTRVQKAINARFDAEAAKAKEEADGKASKRGDASARKAEVEAKRREQELLKDEKISGKIDIEKIRAQSELKLLALEQAKLDADGSKSELERAEKLLDINRQISEEKIKRLNDEKQRVTEDPSKTEADVIRAESEILKEKIDQAKQAHSDLADVARARLSEIELAWRRGQASVEDYQMALVAARQANIITADEVREKTIASGNDMGAALSLGFQRARESMQTDAEMMISIGESISDQIAGGLSSAWDSFITGTKSAKVSLIDFARSTIAWLSQIILKQMLLNALGSAGGNGQSGAGIIGALAGAAASAYSGGGMVQALADGGSVRGWSPSKTADNIPAWLTAREFVQPVGSVDYYGVAFMEMIRRKLFPRNLAHALAGGTLPRIPSGNRLAAGGMAAAAPATTVKSGDTKLRVINVLDSNMVGDYLRGSDGETAIINMIRRNGSSIKAILR